MQRARTSVLARLDRCQRFLGQRFVHRAAQPEHHHRRDTTDRKADAPTEFVDLVIVEERQDQKQCELREHVTADQRHVLKRREKPAPLPRRRLRHVRRRRAVLAAGSEPLHQPSHDEDDRCSHTNTRPRRHHRDDHRTRRHQRHTERQRGPAPATVGKPAEEPRSDRPHHERDSEDRIHVDRRVLIGPIEELALEVRGEHGVDVDVVPLDEVARRSPDRVPDGPAGLGPARRRRRLCGRNGHVGLHAVASAGSSTVTIADCPRRRCDRICERALVANKPREIAVGSRSAIGRRITQHDRVHRRGRRSDLS